MVYSVQTSSDSHLIEETRIQVDRLSAQKGTVKADAVTIAAGLSSWPVHRVDDGRVYHAAIDPGS